MEFRHVKASFCCILVYLMTYVCSEEVLSPPACHSVMTSVEEGTLRSDGKLNAAGFTFLSDQYIRINRTHFRVCICKVRKCFRKCCREGEAFFTNKCQPSNDTLLYPFSPPVYSEDMKTNLSFIGMFYMTYGDTCNNSRYRLDPVNAEEDTYMLLENGHLYTPADGREMEADAFCQDVMVRNTSEIVTIVCFPPTETTPQRDAVFMVYPIIMLISTPFLVAAFLVYALIPELRNFHGLCFMCYVASLFTAYIFLAIVQLGRNDISLELCKASAFIIEFAFMATFFWLNVMCFDIWLAFSGMKGFRGSIRQREMKKFIIYSCYAWGGPVLLLIISLIMDLSPNIPNHILKPEFGRLKCWFATKEANLAYFYGPAAILTTTNMVLFGLTAWKIISVNRETNVLRNGDSRRHDDSNESNTQRFVLYLKLFLVMGLTWIMEIISWAVEGPIWVWLLTDIANTLQGIFIFFIFVWKPRVKKLLILKFCPRYAPESSTSRTGTTSLDSRDSSGISRTQNDSIRVKSSRISYDSFQTKQAKLKTDAMKSHAI